MDEQKMKKYYEHEHNSKKYKYLNDLTIIYECYIMQFRKNFH